MRFGENLQTIRKKNQLSQEGLAEMLGVSRPVSYTHLTLPTTPYV